jgi:hypothetical protein
VLQLSGGREVACRYDVAAATPHVPHQLFVQYLEDFRRGFRTALVGGGGHATTDSNWNIGKAFPEADVLAGRLSSGV